MLRNTKDKSLWNVFLYLLSDLYSEREINKTNFLDAIAYPKIKPFERKEVFNSVTFKYLPPDPLTA